MLATIIEIGLVTLVLVGIANEDKLQAWEENHISKVRSFFASFGYAFLIWLDKLFDLAAQCMARIIIKWRKSVKKKGI